MTYATTLGVPDNWHSSIPHSSSAVAKHPFTCIGVGCWSATPVDWDGKTVTHQAWKCSNSLRTPYRDRTISGNGEWQGVCKECSDSRPGVRTTVLIEAVRQRQHQPQSLPQPPPLKTAEESEIINNTAGNVLSESPKELRLLARKRKRAETNWRRAQSVSDSFRESIPTLTLDMCRNLSKPLTQVVLRAYCKSAGLNQKGSPRELRERLDEAMMRENVTDLSAYIDSTKNSS